MPRTRLDGAAGVTVAAVVTVTVAVLATVTVAIFAGAAVGGRAGAAVVTGIVAVVTGVAAVVTRRGATVWSTTRLGSGLLGRAAGLLPREVGARYAEEWRGELYDLRADGARWWQRTSYVLGVLLWATPVLAVTLRLSCARAVD